MDDEAEPASSWEIGASASGLWSDDDFALGADAQGFPAFGARVAWRPVALAALGIEAWRGRLETAAGDVTVEALGAHFRATPWAARGWPLDPALHFGVERIAVDDDEDRSLAFVAGAGLAHLGPRWVVDLAARNRVLSVGAEAADAIDDPVPRDATLWEVRVTLAVVLGGG